MTNHNKPDSEPGKSRLVGRVAEAQTIGGKPHMGWWHYAERGWRDRPTLIHEDTGELIVMGDPIKGDNQGQGRPEAEGRRWRRFDYVHGEWQYPLAILWMPEDGVVVVDHRQAARMWREESGDSRLYPPYGGWVRADNAIEDAIWCWPGVYEQLLGFPRAARGGIGYIGGWCNGAWRDRYYRASDLPHQRLDHIPNFQSYSEVAHRTRLRSLPDINGACPASWRFIEPDRAQQIADGTAFWQGYQLTREAAPGQSMPGPVLPAVTELEAAGQKLEHPVRGTGQGFHVSVNGVVPHLRAQDNSRILFPVVTRLHYFRPGGGGHSPQYSDEKLGAPDTWPPQYFSVSFWYMESDFSGFDFDVACPMPDKIERGRKLKSNKDVFRCARGKKVGFISNNPSSGNLWGGDPSRPINVLENYPVSKASNSYSGRWRLGQQDYLEAGKWRYYRRIAWEAMLAWSGTEKRSEYWGDALRCYQARPIVCLDYQDNGIGGVGIMTPTMTASFDPTRYLNDTRFRMSDLGLS